MCAPLRNISTLHPKHTTQCVTEINTHASWRRRTANRREEGHSLFPAVAVEEAGPLEAGLLAAHPEDRRDAHHQRHQVLDKEQGQVRVTGLLHLGVTGGEEQGGQVKNRT